MRRWCAGRKKFQSSARISVHFTDDHSNLDQLRQSVSILSEDFRAFHSIHDKNAFVKIVFQSSARISVHFTSLLVIMVSYHKVSILSEDFRAFHLHDSAS